MLNQETKRKIDSCRDMLVGKLPDPKAQIEQITYALIYKFMGDMDKASVALGGKASFFVNGYEQYDWDKLMATNIGGKQRIDLYSEAIAKLSLNSQLPQLFRDIFKDAFLPYRDPETLNMFLKEINWFTYSHSEDLGDAFEYLLSVMSSQGDAGQFRTPRHIIDFIVSVVDPKKDETILDPACGTAGFLISSYKHILNQNAEKNPGDKLTSDEKKDLMNQIVGYDISPDMVRLSLVNMYLHGFPEPHIYEYDTLTDEGRWDDSFDVIMANPPFMSPKGGIRPHKRFSIQANRSEVLFVDYIAEHLNPDGRAGVIVPEGIIFQSGNAYKALRKMLVDNYLFCVVSLPAGVFNPYSGVKTSILFMDKTLAKQTDKILFVKIENDGFDLGAQRREIAGSDFPQALINVKTYLQSVRNGKEFNIADAPNMLLVSKSQLAENGEYNFSLERYKTQELRQTKWPMVELGSVCVQITDGSHFSPETTQQGYPYITVKDLEQGHIDFNECKQIDQASYLRLVKSGCNPKRGDVLFSKDGTIGKTALIDFDRDFVVLSSLSIITPNGNMVLPKYIYLILSSENFVSTATDQKTGVAIRRIVLRTLKTIPIPLPPLNIQQEIVEEIESCQKIIDGARQVVENYKPRIKIDHEWQLTPIGNLVESICLGLVKNKTEQDSKYIYPYIKMNNITNDGALDLTNLVYVDATSDELKQYVLNDGDFIYNTRNSPDLVGKSTVFHGENGKYLFNNNILRIRFGNRVLPDFVNIMMNNEYGKSKIRSQIDGTTSVAALYQKNYLAIEIPLPPISIQQSIVAQIEKEQQLVNATQELIQIYEQKIKDKIAEVWET
jgi:type I restriction enzyme M protein